MDQVRVVLLMISVNSALIKIKIESLCQRFHFDRCELDLSISYEEEESSSPIDGKSNLCAYIPKYPDFT